MKCHFTAHIQRVSAAQAAKGQHVRPGALPSAQNGAAASEYHLMLAALGEDLRQLSNTQSLETKIERKRVMIDRYRDWIAGALMAPQPAQDEIVATMLVWAIDIAEWPLALDLAGFVLRHGLSLPERYRRDAAVVVAEEFAEAGIASQSAIDLATLQQVEAMTESHDMPDQVRAKVKKAIGLSFKARADAFDPTADSGMAGGKPALIHAAIAHLSRAVELDDSCGVKKIIAQLNSQAKKLATEKAA